ncbi:MAG: H-NS histone family protein [Burkholderiaceae bacterium]
MTQSLQDLIAQREALDKKIADARKDARSGALATAKSLIAEFDLNPAELGFDKRGRKPARSSVKPKFRSPSGETWAGRGRKPKWLEEALAAGRKVEEFAV